jgi:cytochrome c oxidase assembly factor CtaG
MQLSALFVVAHQGHLHASQVMRWWTWQPFVVAGLLLSLTLYATGTARLWRSAGIGHGVRWWQAAAFAGGWTSLVIALVSPLDKLSEILFSAHMTQHEILMVVAAPLLVLGRPLVPVIWAFPQQWRIRAAGAVQNGSIAAAWRNLTSPLIATALHMLALWIWHAPALYEATLRNDYIHGVQHSCFLLTAALFWWSLIHGRYGRLGYGVAVLYVFVTTLHSGALGALMTFSTRAWYPHYTTAGLKWGVDAVEDQQLAGLIMWVPAGVILTVLGLSLFAMWLSEAERRVAISEK